MMNKKRTKQIGRTKYIMFLPLAALLLIISNIETVARSTGKIAKAAINSVVADESNSTPDQSMTVRINELQSPQQKKTTPTEAVKDKNGNQVYDMVEQPPSFPGGQDALMKYISTNLKYPASAAEKSLQGRVVAQFVVCSDGSISNAHVHRNGLFTAKLHFAPLFITIINSHIVICLHISERQISPIYSFHILIY